VTPVDVLFAGIPVNDIGTATAWYTRLFQRTPDIVVNENEVMWRIVDDGWIYLVVDVVRAGNAIVTLSVADLEGAAVAIADNGIALGPIERVGDAGRKASVTDLDGNTVAFVEVLGSQA
jgi:glyoxylase I family protein